MNRLGFRFDNLRRTLPELLASENLRARRGLHALRDRRRSGESPLFEQQRRAVRAALADDRARSARAAALSARAPTARRCCAIRASGSIACARACCCTASCRRRWRRRSSSTPVMTLVSRVVAVKGLRPGEVERLRRAVHGRASDDDRDRAGGLRRRPGSAAGRPRRRADSRPPRADRRLGLHGHADGRRHRHGRLAGRRGRDHRIRRATIASTCARWRRRSARFRGRSSAASASRIERVYD